MPLPSAVFLAKRPNSYYSYRQDLKGFMILIISPDEDFSATVAEQVSVELKLSCQIVGTQEEARKLPAGGYGLIVTTETLTGKWPIPAISIGRDDNKASRTPPVKMQDLLADMREILHKAATAEVLALGQGYHFLPMQKEIKSRGKSVALTDKGSAAA